MAEVARFDGIWEHPAIQKVQLNKRRVQKVGFSHPRFHWNLIGLIVLVYWRSSYSSWWLHRLGHSRLWDTILTIIELSGIGLCLGNLISFLHRYFSPSKPVDAHGLSAVQLKMMGLTPKGVASTTQEAMQSFKPPLYPKASLQTGLTLRTNTLPAPFSQQKSEITTKQPSSSTMDIDPQFVKSLRSSADIDRLLRLDNREDRQGTAENDFKGVKDNMDANYMQSMLLPNIAPTHKYQTAPRPVTTSSETSKIVQSLNGIALEDADTVLARLSIQDKINDWAENARDWIGENVFKPLVAKMKEIDAQFKAEGLDHLNCESAGWYSQSSAPANKPAVSNPPAPTTSFASFQTSQQQQQQQPQNIRTLQDLLQRFPNSPVVRQRLEVEKYLTMPRYTSLTQRLYILSRIKTLGKSAHLAGYKWNAVSVEDSTGKARSAELPTDAELVMHIFCVFLDLATPGEAQAILPYVSPFSQLYFVDVDGKEGKFSPRGTDQTINEESTTFWTHCAAHVLEFAKSTKQCVLYRGALRIQSPNGEQWIPRVTQFGTDGSRFDQCNRELIKNKPFPHVHGSHILRQLQLSATDVFIAERRLVQTSPLNQLDDIRVGVEGNYWIRRLLQSALKESAPAAMGGLPLGLRAALVQELEKFRIHNIHPIFVFNGLALARKDKPFSTEDYRPARRSQAWTLYEQGKGEAAMGVWGSSGSINAAELVPSVIDILVEHDIDFIRAPYTSWGQLAYLLKHPQQLINAIYAGSELLMYDIDRVITNLDFEHNTYNWISKQAVLQDLQISSDQFLDICILAGFDYCSTFPPLTSDLMSFTFKGTHDLIKQYNYGQDAVQAYAVHPAVVKSNYADSFSRTKCTIKYHVIYTVDGDVQPLNREKAPSDIHEFIGYRLPDEVHYYLSRGLVGPQTINTLTSGILIETPPLCNGETTEYHNFLNQLLPLRTLTLCLLAQPLHQFYVERKVASVYWFEPNVDHVMPFDVIKPPVQGKRPAAKPAMSDAWKAINSCFASPAFLTEEKKRQNVKVTDLSFCLKICRKSEETSKLFANTTEPLSAEDDIVSNVLLKTLVARSFLGNKGLSLWGKALEAAVEKTSVPQEYYITALELIGLGILSANKYSRTYRDPYVVGNDEEQKHMLLISRTFSLVPVQFNGNPWSGTLSHELLVFNSFAKALNRSYRNLMEMLTLNMLLTGKVQKKRDDYFGIAKRLPYMYDNNTALGLIVQFFLSATVANQTESASGQPLQQTIDTFVACSDLQADLRRGFAFWNGLIKAIKMLLEGANNSKKSDIPGERNIDESILKQFIDADQWVSKVVDVSLRQ